MGFPIITNEIQCNFESIQKRKEDVPEICGYYGRACRQMNKDEGSNRFLCTKCALAEFAKGKWN